MKFMDNMNKHHCFLICGENGVGKTTTSLILQEMTGYPVYNFADSLKEFINDYNSTAIDDYNHNYINWNDNEEKNIYRNSLIYGANSFKEVFGKDFFAREVYRRMGEANRCIIGDLRFEEELDFIDSNFITYDIIYITKDIHQDPTKIFPFLAGMSINLVENNGTLEELKEKLQEIFDINKYKCTPL